MTTNVNLLAYRMDQVEGKVEKHDQTITNLVQFQTELRVWTRVIGASLIVTLGAFAKTLLDLPFWPSP